MPTRRRSTAARRPAMPLAIRRKRDWARRRHSGNVGTAAPVLFDLLEDYKVVAGISQGPPCTIGGVIWSLSARHSVTSSSTVVLDQVVMWAIGVFPNTIDSADLDISLTNEAHFDWMDFGRAAWNSNESAKMAPFFTDRRVRAQRKMEPIGEKLLLVLSGVGSVGAINVDLQMSTLLILH